jgi:DNA-binding MarR family transcriptional regulator
MTASELNILKTMYQKNSVMTMKEISRRSAFEITYTYMLCKSLEKKDYIGFFTHSSCKITAKGKDLVCKELDKNKVLK